jgi:hypothetical protein
MGPVNGLFARNSGTGLVDCHSGLGQCLLSLAQHQGNIEVRAFVFASACRWSA